VPNHPALLCPKVEEETAMTEKFLCKVDIPIPPDSPNTYDFTKDHSTINQ